MVLRRVDIVIIILQVGFTLFEVILQVLSYEVDRMTIAQDSKFTVMPWQ